MTSHELFFISKRPNDVNELLPFSDSFINNEKQSNEILNIIKVRFSLLRYFLIIPAFIPNI